MAARRWRLLLNVIDNLPGDSAYGEALASDVEMARLAPESKREYRPSLREWSTEAELLAGILDRLADVVVSNGAEKYKPKPFPRPVTAREVLRREKSRRSRARVRELFRPQEGGA